MNPEYVSTLSNTLRSESNVMYGLYVMDLSHGGFRLMSLFRSRAAAEAEGAFLVDRNLIINWNVDEIPVRG